MKIDSHQHFWRYNPARDRWITDEMAVLKRDFLPDELNRELAADGIDASIAVQADQSAEETLFLTPGAAAAQISLKVLRQRCVPIHDHGNCALLRTKRGSSLLVTSIIGGAVFPAVIGRISNVSNIQSAFMVPLI
jgi:hypothetical protein